jgi:hypothetical protein
VKDGIALMATGEKSDKGGRVHRERARKIKGDRETLSRRVERERKGRESREINEERGIGWR